MNTQYLEQTLSMLESLQETSFNSDLDEPEVCITCYMPDCKCITLTKWPVGMVINMIRVRLGFPVNV